MIEIHRLLDEIERAFLHRRHGFFYRSVRGHNDHGQSGLHAARFAQHVNSGVAGKLQIGEDHQVASRANFINRGISIRRFFDGVAGAFQSLAQHGAQLGFIFDQ